MSLVLLVIVVGAALSCSAIARHHGDFRHESVSRSAADPITGEWNVSFHVHNTTTPGTFNLKLDGQKVSGTAFSEHTGPGTVRDGSWTNNKLSFTLDFAKHESIAITGGLQDGNLAGEFTTEGFTSTWEAKRK
jgi:hypothetical protein